MFDHFLHFFPFDSLGAVPENPGTVLRSVRFSVGTIRRGTTVHAMFMYSEETKCQVLTLSSRKQAIISW